MIHPVAKQVLDPCRPDRGAGRGDLCKAHRDFREVLCRPYASLASLASRLHENDLKYKGEIEFPKIIQRTFFASLMCHYVSPESMGINRGMHLSGEKGEASP